MSRIKCFYVFLLSMALMNYSFFFSEKVGSYFSNGFLSFLLTDLIWVFACIFFIASFLSVLFSALYLISRGDKDLKFLTENLFGFLIWDELKKN